MSTNITDKLNKMSAAINNKTSATPSTTPGVPSLSGAGMPASPDKPMDPATMGQIMRKAQEIQLRMQDIQRQIADMTVVGQSGGGAVEVTMTGLHYAKSVSIDDSAHGMAKAILEDLIAAAINNAVDKIEKGTREKMAALAETMEPGDKASSSSTTTTST